MIDTAAQIRTAVFAFRAVFLNLFTFSVYPVNLTLLKCGE